MYHATVFELFTFDAFSILLLCCLVVLWDLIVIAKLKSEEVVTIESDK